MKEKAKKKRYPKPRVSEKKNQNRIGSRQEFEALLDKLFREGELSAAFKLVAKQEFETEYEWAAALLDWLFEGGPNFKGMQIKMIILMRSFVLLGRGDFIKFENSDEFLDHLDRTVN